MNYEFPDGETMGKYQALLMAVIIEARHLATNPDTPRRQVTDLMDAIHNIPDLLCRWPDVHEDYILADLESCERKYYDSKPKFTRILKEGPHEGWQLKWVRMDKLEEDKAQGHEQHG